MPTLQALPATYKLQGPEWILEKFRELDPAQGRAPGMPPKRAFTICCPVNGCGGHGGHLVAFVQLSGRRELPDSEFWIHISPRGYARDEVGNACKSQRRRERERGHALIGRYKDSKSRTSDLYSRPLGPKEIPGDSWGIMDHDEILSTECCNCGRPLTYSVEAALR